MSEAERIWFAFPLYDLPESLIARPTGEADSETEFLPEDSRTHVARVWPQIIIEADKAAERLRRHYDKPSRPGRPTIKRNQKRAIQIIATEWHKAYGEKPTAREDSPFMRLLEAVYHYAAPETQLPSAPTVKKVLRKMEEKNSA